MFGDVKKVARFIRKAATDAALASFAPDIARRFAELQRNSSVPEYFIHVMPRDRVIYIDVPKAGGTTIKMYLSERLKGKFEYDPLLVYKRNLSGIPSIRSVGVRRFFEIVDHPDTMIFTFVRNPYTRLISCYRDKFQPYPMGHAGGCNRDPDMQLFFEDRLRELDPDKPLPFEWFVDLAAATCRSGGNGHWLTMDWIVPKRDAVPTFIGRLERFQADFQIVADRLRTDQIPLQFNSSDAVCTRDWITPAIRDKIRTAYRDDFDRFGYSLEVPA